MILIVNLNPALDRIYSIDNFQLNAISRTKDCQIQAGGKGVNAARACNILKQKSVVTGLIGGITGQIIVNNLQESLINNDFSETTKNSRTCIIIADQERKTSTVINEDGPILSSKDVKAFTEKFKRLIPQVKLLVISGSIPASVNLSIYTQLIDIAKNHNVKTILDTSKSALKATIDSDIFMLKINLQEFSELFNAETLLHEVNAGNFSLLKTYSQNLIEKNIENIVISLGEQGAWLYNTKQTILVTPPVIKAKNPIGSGDCMTAGIACSLVNNESITDAVVSGVAAGTTNALVGGISFSYSSFSEIKKQVKIIKGVF